MTSEILFSRRTFAGARFAERSTGNTYLTNNNVALRSNHRNTNLEIPLKNRDVIALYVLIILLMNIRNGN